MKSAGTCDTSRKAEQIGEDRQAAIEREVLQRLSHIGVASGDAISCECREGRLILSGILPSYYYKQLAQEVAGHVPGVRVVRNNTRVDSMTGHS